MNKEAELELTVDERLEGWHFCPEWDYMLVGPEMEEWEACLCYDHK